MKNLTGAQMVLSAASLACCLEGAGATEFSAISIDTRTIVPGCLYVALRGARFDGHDFAATAKALGAAALLVERRVAVELPQLIVADARAALGALAAHARAQLSLPLIAVTGSNGKTTTTQMTAAILARAYGERDGEPAWFATRGNRNNDVGVPLMLLELRPQHRAAVLELGMNHPGEIARLSAWARPTVALVTNAQREHQEFLDSVAATARENGAAIASLGTGGVAAFAADDPCAPIWRELSGARRVVDFALRGPAAVSAELRVEPDQIHLEVRTPSGPFATTIALGGEHNARNALAATACAIAIGIAPSVIAQGLANFRPVAGRGTVRTIGAATVIDDSYNANPDSVRAAIDLLARHPGDRILVFGDMGEVGERGGEFHREIGAYARIRGVQRLLALGKQAQQTVAAFGEGAQHFANHEDLAMATRALVEDAGGSRTTAMTLLVKGSRFMTMEKVIAALAGDAAGKTVAAPVPGRDHA